MNKKVIDEAIQFLCLVLVVGTAGVLAAKTGLVEPLGILFFLVLWPWIMWGSSEN